MASQIQLLVGGDRTRIGGRSLTAQYSDLTYSNVDPGGFEQLTATIVDPAGLEVGQEVVVRYGLEVSWQGRLNEIGERSSDGRSTTQITALGYGAKLTDERMPPTIYADRDLSQWGEISIQRRLNLAGVFPVTGSQAVASDGTGNPAVVLSFSRFANAGALREFAGALYRAPPGAEIGSVYYDLVTRDLNANVTLTAPWISRVELGTDDTFASEDQTANLAPGPSTGTLTATTARTAAEVYLFDDVGGAADGAWSAFYRRLTVFGDHGLTKRGSDPKGFYPHDIVGHVRADYETANFGGLIANGFRPHFILVADDSSSLTVGHAVYREPTPHQNIIADMATLMGWHYGVWEPASIMDSTPRLFFTAPPADVTCVVARNEIQDLDSPRVRVDRLYETAQVKYADPAGAAGIATVTIRNPFVPLDAKFDGRVLDLDMGQGDASSAAAFGAFALQLALAGARGGGSGVIPDTVVIPGGGRKAACLLRSGRDRLRIMDLPGSGSFTAPDTDRQDSFLVRRVETTVKSGHPVTRVEFDGGADLLEVLQARLQLAAFG